MAFLLTASLLLLVVSRYGYIILGDTQQQSFMMPFLRGQAHTSAAAAAPWDSRILHIVVTRFMQDQPTLKWLARARLKLFQYICLPTMVHQTVTTNVIWLVQTDPNLLDEIRVELEDLLKPYSNFFLMGTNEHEWTSFRDEDDLLDFPVYTGNRSLLQSAYAGRATIPIVLQTRLDADDGLNVHYLELLQYDALQQFASNNGRNWFYWCIKRHVEWHSDTNRLLPIEHSRLCVTPGLTVGTTATTTASTTSDTTSGDATTAKEDTTTTSATKATSSLLQPPFYMPHDVLFKELEKKPPGYCGGMEEHCIRMVDELPIGAIRSRTLTSAGMMDVFSKSHDYADRQEALWDMLSHEFGLSSSLEPVQDFLNQHVIEIARDNLQGQCTEGHSCKLQSIEALQRLIDVQREGRGVGKKSK